MCFDLWQWALEDERWYHLEYKIEIHVENVKLTISCICYTVYSSFKFYFLFIYILHGLENIFEACVFLQYPQMKTLYV